MSTSSDSREFLDLFYRDGMVIMGAEGQNPSSCHADERTRVPRTTPRIGGRSCHREIVTVV